MSSHWYEAVIEKFGTAENFVDQLYEKQFGGSVLNYKDVVVAENRHKVYGCEITNSKYVRLEVVEGIKMNTWFLQDYDDIESSTYYLESDIVEIYNEITDLDEDCDDEDEEGFYGVKIDEESLKPFTTPSSNVYKYVSLDELNTIIKALDEPIIDELGCSWEKDYKKGLLKSYGLVFFWSEYDDFSCGNPFTPYCKIIDGGSIQ